VIGENVKSQIDYCRESFQSARPFKHLCIDGFLRLDVAEQLSSEFPPFRDENARNEFGEVGGKAVVTDIASISPSYRDFHAYLFSREFIDTVSRMLGIPDLLMDPSMYGGGTHENLHGQELDVHVDFNYDPATKLHRRVNMLVYLNKEWRDEWGGAIELHSDPWDWEHNKVVAIGPAFNRCVVFETNEHSWHGFKRIRLPEDRRHLSRRCISIYLYTLDRPKEEIVPEHGTFYVQRPLPEHLEAGYMLTDTDVSELKQLLRKRDVFLQHYQRMELDNSARLGRYSRLKSRSERWLRVVPRPLRGAVRRALGL
jgi:Rps23 Pro-64 3,4-dihydroxylase Tpa1-like proline 4-hydroxylase